MTTAAPNTQTTPPPASNTPPATTPTTTPAATDAGAGGQPAQAAAPTGGDPAANAQATPPKDASPATAQPTAPEKYEFKQVGETPFDVGVITAFSDIAKKHNLSQESAQAILDTVTPVMRAQAQEQVQAVQTEWQTAAKSDKEFGGDKFDENMATAKTALKRFSDPKFVEFLDASGLGNHPEMIRAWWKVGQLISEDRFVAAGGANNAPASAAQRMYPGMNP